MNISRLVDKKIIRLFLIGFFLPLQSCSNTLIGEKLENSFDNIEGQKINNKAETLSEKTKIKLKTKDDTKENKKDFVNVAKENLISNKDSLSQKSTKPIKRTIFKPQPYRIILRLSGANPSAPAETVTEALRKAGVQFEVEKIERYDEQNFPNNTSLNR